MSNAGTTYIISAPSGAGKTSLVHELLNRVRSIELSVSLTTRRARPGETDGVHYNFVDRIAFERAIEQDEMLEHAEVFGNLYGTSKRFVQDRLDAGADVLLEIDWQGAQLARARLQHTVSVMILPPSLTVLETRLRGRGQDADDVIARRLAEARTELSHMVEFDYWVVNDDFTLAADQLCTIISTERLRPRRQRQRHPHLVAGLLNP